MCQAFTNVRALRALNMRRRGLRLIDIAKEFDVTRERARQLVMLGIEIERRMVSCDPWDKLPARCRNALTATGCEPTPAGVSEHFKTHDIKRVPAIGKKAIADLNAWLTQHDQAPIT
jgi:hypothetical protein